MYRGNRAFLSPLVSYLEVAAGLFLPSLTAALLLPSACSLLPVPFPQRSFAKAWSTPRNPEQLCARDFYVNRGVGVVLKAAMPGS